MTIIRIHMIVVKEAEAGADGSENRKNSNYFLRNVSFVQNRRIIIFFRYWGVLPTGGLSKPRTRGSVITLEA